MRRVKPAGHNIDGDIGTLNVYISNILAPYAEGLFSSVFPRDPFSRGSYLVGIDFIFSIADTPTWDPTQWDVDSSLSACFLACRFAWPIDSSYFVSFAHCFGSWFHVSWMWFGSAAASFSFPSPFNNRIHSPAPSAVPLSKTHSKKHLPLFPDGDLIKCYAPGRGGCST